MDKRVPDGKRSAGVTRWWRSLRARVIGLAILTSLPGLVAVGFDKVTLVAQTQEISRISLTKSLSHAKDVYDDMIQHAETRLAAVTASMPDGETACPPSFGGFVRDYPEYRSAGIAREDGQLVCLFSTPGRAKTLIGHELLLQALQNGGHVVEFVDKPEGYDKPRLLVAQQIASRSSVRYVAFLAIAFRPLADITATPQLRDAREFLIDSAGNVTSLDDSAHHAASKESVRRAIADKVLHPSNTPTALSLQQIGQDLVAWLPLGRQAQAGALALSIPSTKLYGHAETTMRGSLGMILAALLLSMIVIWWLGYTLILRPTQRVMRTTNLLAQGDFSARTGMAPGKDEIARIAMALDQMAEHFQQTANERTHHLKSLERSNRLHNVLSAINAAIFRRIGVIPLLDEVCRVVCSIGGYRVAWIGEVDFAEKVVKEISWTGSASQFKGPTRLPLDPSQPGGNGPAAKAVREGISVVHNHYPDGLHTCAWQEQWQLGGIRSVAAFPMGFSATGQRRILVVGVDQEGYFEAEEIHILEQLVQEASFGLHLTATEQTLDHASTHDSVTGLANSRLLEQRLSDDIGRARAAQKHVLVAVIEVGFQSTAAQWGSRPAEELFNRVAREIQLCVDEMDFVGVLPGARLALIMCDQECIDVAERRMETLAGKLLATSIKVQDDSITPTPRIGISVFPGDGDDAHDLLDKAQAALTESHPGAAGAIRFFAPDISQALHESRRLEQQLGNAIGAGEFELYYQPIIDLASHALRGFEALLRWKHPTLGLLLPQDFIPLAENSGLILPIGDWVIGEAARQAALWEQQGVTNLFITLNVSATQMRDPQFGERVAARLHDFATETRHVRLAMEITESQLIGDIDSSAALLSKLRNLGVGIVIDDFGTGYSSLSYLHRLPVDVLKIDKSFTSNMDNNMKARMIVEGILALAKSLELETVAEGIERKAQCDAVTQMGCTYAQGFWFDRALTATEAANKWLLTIA
jgi:diguanylate cyclase (GGDEF)-like protein